MLCVRNTRKHFTMRYVYLTSIGAGGFLGKHLYVHVRVRYTVYWTMYMYGTLCIKYSKKQVLQYIPGLYCTISVYGSSCNFFCLILSSFLSISSPSSLREAMPLLRKRRMIMKNIKLHELPYTKMKVYM